MREHLGYFGPLWRWASLGLIFVCARELLSPSPKAVEGTLLLLVIGLALFSYEIYRRLFPRSVTRNGTSFDLYKRGRHLGSFDFELSQGWRAQRASRDLIRWTAISVLVMCGGVGTALSDGSSRKGLAVFAFGALSLAALLHDRLRLSTLIAPTEDDVVTITLLKSDAQALLHTGTRASGGQAHVRSEPHAEASPSPSSVIALRKTADTGTFARYQPFDDNREVIVRRGRELGHDYGLSMRRRAVKVGGVDFELVTYQQILSPPVQVPGQPSLADSGQYRPISEVLYLPDAEVLIRREPNGFSSAELELILQAITPAAIPAARRQASR